MLSTRVAAMKHPCGGAGNKSKTKKIQGKGKLRGELGGQEKGEKQKPNLVQD